MSLARFGIPFFPERVIELRFAPVTDIVADMPPPVRWLRLRRSVGQPIQAAASIGRSTAEFLELCVEVAERGVLAGPGRRTRHAARGEIAAAEQIGGRDHRRAHGAVFVSALRPREVAFQPEIEAHWLYFTTVRDCTASTSSPLEKGLRSARADGKRAMSDGSGRAAR